MYNIENTIKLIGLLAILVLAESQLKAQADSSFSFNLLEAQNYAVEHSYMNQQAVKDVEKSEKQVNETIGTGLPQVSASGYYQNYIQVPIQLIPASAFGGPEDEFQEVFFGTEHQMGAAVNVDQLIFDGSYFVGLQASKVFLQITKNDLIRSELDVRNTVLVAYGDVLVAEKNVEILRSNKENLEENFEETKALYESGFLEEQDADQIELLLSTVTNNYERAVRGAEIVKNQLKFALGIDIAAELTLTEDLETIVMTNSEGTPIFSEDFDVTNHIDYQIIENQGRASELLWKQQKSTYLPRLSAFYTAQTNAFSNEFDFLDNKKFFPSQLIGLNLNVPIFSGTSRINRVQQAKIDYEKTNIAKKQVEQQLELNLSNTQSRYIFALSQYNTSERNMDLADRIYNKTKIKYDEGISSSLDLNQASTQLLDAQADFINAALSLINAKSQLNIALNKY
ncbi:MAG: TolC family protein [Vicingaceae bacterium]